MNRHPGAQGHRGGFAPSMDENPVVVFWEVTRACALVCRHCRASAQPQRNPLELTTEEFHHVLDDLASFDVPPVVVFTGGDPFMRRDLFDIAGYAIDKGLRTSLSPSVTALVTEQRLTQLAEAGVAAISFSLDGAGPEVHDSFRGIAGSFERTVQVVSTAIQVGLSVQVNTTVSRWNLAELPRMEELVGSLGVPLWDLFFLVPTGRALTDDLLSPEEHEQVFNWIYELEGRSPFRVKTTLGQPYRRIRLSRRLEEEGRDWRELSPAELLRAWAGGAASNDGKGIMFISHVGQVQPSGFLPLQVGDVRKHSVVDLYRNAPLFRSLRSTDELKGKCGRCPFRLVCGGCRARAYAMTGDPLEADPTCPFQPPGAGVEDRTAAAGLRRNPPPASG